MSRDNPACRCELSLPSNPRIMGFNRRVSGCALHSVRAARAAIAAVACGTCGAAVGAPCLLPTYRETRPGMVEVVQGAWTEDNTRMRGRWTHPERALAFYAAEASA